MSKNAVPLVYVLYAPETQLYLASRNKTRGQIVTTWACSPGHAMQFSEISTAFNYAQRINATRPSNPLEFEVCSRHDLGNKWGVKTVIGVPILDSVGA